VGYATTGVGPLLGRARVRQGQARLGRIRPMANENWKKAFLIFKSFLTSKPI
jgi:hypothetical protein